MKKVIGIIACAICLLAVLIMASIGVAEFDLIKMGIASICVVLGGCIAAWAHLTDSRPFED